MKKIINKIKNKERQLTIKEYFKIVGRVVKTNWQIDKLSLIARLLAITVEVVATVLATYFGSRVVGEVVASVAGGATKNLYLYAVISTLTIIIVNLSASLQNLLDRIIYIKWDKWFTIKRAQRIVVLEKGQIVEQGTHQELMKNSKLYAEMFNKQAEGYQT